LVLGISGAGAATSSAPPLATPLYQPVTTQPVTLADPGVVVTRGEDAPDPYIVKANGVYVMFASQDQFYGPNIPVRVSNTLDDWSGPAVDAMPTLPPWAGPGFTWAPDVLRVGHTYLMWFTAVLAASGANFEKCIGVATATSVVGPYHSAASQPLVCQLDHLGSIDPRAFVDPAGRLWLLWKSDDNADLTASTHSTLWVQRLSANGLELLGQPVALMTANMPWEGRIVESPDMVYAAGHFWLFFSGNWFNEPDYAVGIAECAAVTGPCEPTTPGPWLSSNGQGSGPGEESVFFDGSRWWMLYAPFAVNYQIWTARPAALVRLDFGADGPSVVPPGTKAWQAPEQLPRANHPAETPSVRTVRCSGSCRSPDAFIGR
jgi:beta-xylosidase